MKRGDSIVCIVTVLWAACWLLAAATSLQHHKTADAEERLSLSYGCLEIAGSVKHEMEMYRSNLVDSYADGDGSWGDRSERARVHRGQMGAAIRDDFHSALYRCMWNMRDRDTFSGADLGSIVNSDSLYQYIPWISSTFRRVHNEALNRVWLRGGVRNERL